MISPKTILVTGCAGFIGGNFTQQFKEKFPKTKIIGIDDLSSGRKDAINSSVVFLKKSILDGKSLEEIFSKYKPEYVFHFAALPRVSYSVEYPRKTSEVNILGTVVLLELSKKYKVKRFVYSSSSSVYGDAKKLPTKESENIPDPRSPYAIQKYTGEMFCKTFSELFGLETICLRYFSVFGPGQYGNSAYSQVVSSWLESLYFPQNKKAFMEGDGTQSRDFCYVNNVVLANILSMESQRHFKGEVFNVAYGGKTKIKDIKILIEKYTNKKLKLEKRSKRPGDAMHTHANLSKARELLGYEPAIDFNEGLKRTIEWFKSRHR